MLRFADWIFDRLNDVRKNDLQKQYLISAFRRSIENERACLCLKDQIKRLSEQLKKILESVVYAPLMMVLTDTILDLAKIYHHVFYEIFSVGIVSIVYLNVFVYLKRISRIF